MTCVGLRLQSQPYFFVFHTHSSLLESVFRANEKPRNLRGFFHTLSWFSVVLHHVFFLAVPQPEFLQLIAQRIAADVE